MAYEKLDNSPEDFTDRLGFVPTKQLSRGNYGGMKTGFLHETGRDLVPVQGAVQSNTSNLPAVIKERVANAFDGHGPSLAQQLKDAKDSGERFEILAEAVKRNPDWARDQVKDLDAKYLNLDGLDLKGEPNPDLKAVLKIIPSEKISLKGANLANQDMSELNLKDAHLEGAILVKANLKGADLTGAHLENANLRETNLEGAILAGADLHGADLSGANLRRANLTGANVEKANLSGADLTSANLTNAILKDAKLQGAILAEANLKGANLTGADLTGANLKNANLEGALLAGAIFDRANLAGANLKDVKAQGASFAGADLRGAILTNADFSGAKLQGANMDGAAIAGLNLTGATGVYSMKEARLGAPEATRDTAVKITMGATATNWVLAAPDAPTTPAALDSVDPEKVLAAMNKPAVGQQPKGDNKNWAGLATEPSPFPPPG